MEYTQLAGDVQRLTESLGELPEPIAEPAFIAVSGLPGTGKSYFCNKLAVPKIRHHHYAVDTSRDITPVLDKIVREVRR